MNKKLWQYFNKKLFKCKYYGYKKVETYGDVIPVWIIAKHCPKCKKIMCYEAIKDIEPKFDFKD